jgi:hypothetical protein
MAKALFITRDDLVKYTALNGNIDTDTFIQYIIIAQDLHIQNYLGTRLFKKFNDGIIDNNLTQTYKDLLTDYIKPMLIHWAMVEFLPFSAYTIANKGVFKHTSENATSVDKSEVDYLVEKERSVANHYTTRFVDYMCFNQSSFPEYNLNSNGDMFPDSESNFYGWVL